MARRIDDTEYRKIDVDSIDPVKYRDVDDADESLLPDERLVNQLLLSNKLNEALKAALQNPPLKSKSQEVKNRATALVTKVLTSFKTSELEETVHSLTDDEVDLLMKYIYKAMDTQADNATCPYLLAWHSQIGECYKLLST